MYPSNTIVTVNIEAQTKAIVQYLVQWMQRPRNTWSSHLSMTRGTIHNCSCILLIPQIVYVITERLQDLSGERMREREWHAMRHQYNRDYDFRWKDRLPSYLWYGDHHIGTFETSRSGCCRRIQGRRGSRKLNLGQISGSWGRTSFG